MAGEMTRDELNKMKKQDLIEHLARHGMKPNRKSIVKGNLIDLIIKGGFNKPPPESEDTKEDKEDIQTHLTPQNKPTMPTVRMFTITGQEARACKSMDDVDDLLRRNYNEKARFL